MENVAVLFVALALDVSQKVFLPIFTVRRFLAASCQLVLVNIVS